MDIVELLVLLAFILFPLLQSVLEKLGGAGRRGLPPDVDLPPQDRADTGGPLSTPDAGMSSDTPAGHEAEEGWSAGWGRWPSDTLEDLSAEEVVTEEVAEEIVARQRRLGESVTVTEAARVTVPVVSLESVQAEPAERLAGVKPIQRLPPPTIRRRPLHPTIRGVGSRSELRRAIVLAEILGPPRGLEDMGVPGLRP